MRYPETPTDSEWVIFDTDSRKYLTKFAHTITLQAQKIRPSSAGDFTDLRPYMHSPRFPSSLGPTFLGRPGSFDLFVYH